MSVKFAPLCAEDQDTPIYLDEVMEQHFPPDTLAESQWSYDLDGNLVIDDTGRQVFAQKTAEPEYWRSIESDFFDVVLPAAHLNVFYKGAQGLIDQLDKKKCQLVLDLAVDLTQLFTAIKDRANHGEFDGMDFHTRIQDPMINEFTYKMFALDDLAMEMDRILSDLIGAYLLRTRFAQSHKSFEITNIARRIMNHQGEQVTFAVQRNGALKDIKRKVKANHPLLQGKTSITLDLGPRPNTKMLEIIHRSSLDPGHMPLSVIITANHQIVGDVLSGEEPYLTALQSKRHISRRRGEKLVHGTKLDLDHDTQMLRSSVKGRPLFGEEKRRISGEIAERNHTIPRFASGDSGTDIEIGLQGVRGKNRGQGSDYPSGDGIFVITPQAGLERGENPEGVLRHSNPERVVEGTRRAFLDRILARFGGDKEIVKAIGKRVLIIIPDLAA